MTITINGVEMLDYVMAGGVTWQTISVAGQNAGTLLNGKTIRDLIAVKNSLVLTFMPLTPEEMATVKSACTGEYVQGVVTLPSGEDKSGDFIIEPFSAGVFSAFSNRWLGATLTLVER